MKKFYSLVLMAAALLIGTNAWADATEVSNWAQLKAALEAGGQVKLAADFTETVTTSGWVGAWIGSANHDADAKSAELDMNGHNITIQANGSNIAIYPFVITKGELKIVNKAAAKSTIDVQLQAKKTAGGTNVFYVFGSYDYGYDPKVNPFSHLEIGSNVLVKTNNGTVVCVDQKTTKNAVATGYHTQYFTTRGFAFGARVDVKGELLSAGGYKCYGIKTNGNLGYPGETRTVNTASWITADYKAHVADSATIAHAPYVHVWPGAKVNSDNAHLADASCAVYCSGYAQWLVEGACDGATGLYASSGAIDINNATISSSAEEYYQPSGAGHADAVGSAIVINSRDGYAGAIDVEISGTTEVSAVSGYAIEEAVNTTTTIDPETQQEKKETKVENITINGGSFQGGVNPDTQQQQPAVIISGPTSGNEEAEVVVYGANINGSVVIEGQSGDKLEDFLADDVHTTTIIVDNQPVVVVSEGDEPDGQPTIAGHAGEAVKWTGATETISSSISLAELEINNMHKVGTTYVADPQTLTIQSGVTFTVGRVVMGEKAQIIVEQGAKFIVNDKQGVVAPKASNIILKSSENNPAIFVFHPGVTDNTNPKATVEFVSRSCYRYPDYKNIYQRFGIPMKAGGLDSIGTESHETRFFSFDYTANKWNGIGYINPSAGYESDKLDITKMNNPFDYYQLLDFTATTPAQGATYTMVGSLLGNSEPTMAILANSWKGFANSYMGEMSLSELLALIPNTVDKAVYTYDITSAAATWEPVTNLNSEDAILNPMQPFLIRNRFEAAEVELDYEHAVYNPTVGIVPNQAGAPRRAASNVTKAKLIVKGENCIDRVIVAEDAQFSAEFDNGFDASKFMNEGINMYVSADEKMSIFATDNLNNTYVGLQTINGGNYTIEFANVQGAELTLVDHETGARVAMVEGAMYEFTAAANSVNDYRFEIVESAKLPTAIENTEAVKSAKGIYTITGQYVGEMNVWNTLPAGIYVINGEKRVK